MVSFDPKVRNEYGLFSPQKVGGVNPFTSSQQPTKTGEATGGTAVKGWEAYHTGQGPNGLNGGFLSDGTGDNGKHRLNLYL